MFDTGDGVWEPDQSLLHPRQDISLLCHPEDHQWARRCRGVHDATGLCALHHTQWETTREWVSVFLDQVWAKFRIGYCNWPHQKGCWTGMTGRRIYRIEKKFNSQTTEKLLLLIKGILSSEALKFIQLKINFRFWLKQFWRAKIIDQNVCFLMMPFDFVCSKLAQKKKNIYTHELWLYIYI